MLGAAAIEEYQKALILESLLQGPQSVREIAAACGLPVYTISQRLADVEKAGKAAFQGFEGNTPKFIRSGA
ncbi:MAG: helix-turn-helix domain-containing protein [Syntrophobacteraceae bacterium]|nr:helix-turn-helix domain-containing protein [Syntrophobacteraceae bacterium]